jgi:PIN domain nuclease of toxin-antitoxin system
VILIDTNVLLHALTSPQRLSTATRRLLEGSTDIYVSSLSFLELAIKERVLGRGPSDILGVVKLSNIQVLDYTAQDAAEIRNFASLSGHDPFDRALLAQASNNGARFLTSDQKLLKLGLSWVTDSQE